MLLQPRKFKRKSLQKNRSFKIWAHNSLSYGTSGIRIQQSLRLAAKQIYRLRLFLKRAARKADITLRYMWFVAFPHLPLTRKGKGSRMGKGAGKLSAWGIQLQPGTVLIEFKNLRFGRAVHVCKQVSYKSIVNVQLLIVTLASINIRQTARANTTILPFN